MTETTTTTVTTITTKLGRKTVVDADALFKALTENPDLSHRSLRERFGGSPATIKRLRDEFFKSNVGAVTAVDPASTLVKSDDFAKAVASLVAIVQADISDPLKKTIEALTADNKRLEAEMLDYSEAADEYEREMTSTLEKQNEMLADVGEDLRVSHIEVAQLKTAVEVANAKLATVQAELEKLQAEHKTVLIEHAQMQLLLTQKQAEEQPAETKKRGKKATDVGSEQP